MKKMLLGALCAMLLGMPTFSTAEPIGDFEQAGLITGIQVGFDFQYAYEKLEQEGVQTAIENTITEVPIYVRFGIPVIEFKLSMPYGQVQDNVDSALTEDFSGIRNIGLGIKTPILPTPILNISVGLDTKFPTAEPEKYFFGEGIALDPYLAIGVNLMAIKLHANVGYEYRGGYNSSFNPLTAALDDAVEIKPGDATHFAVGAEIETPSLFTVHLELVGVQYGEVKIDSNPLDDSAGRTMSIIPGVSIAKGPFRAQVGMAIPLEVEEDRPSYAPRSDWQILAGASLYFGL